MEYQVKRIKSPEEIDKCQEFAMDHFQWTRQTTPRAHGKMGYIKGQGFYVNLVCEEKNPRRECKGPRGRYSVQPGTRVCDDSAMEVFLAFPEEGEPLSDDSFYVNFEVNGNGQLFAQYGKGRTDRKFLPEKEYEACQVQAQILENMWKVSFYIPETFLKNCCKVDADSLGSGFYCNFYKISETPQIEHYAAYAPLDSETPNFHLPRCFAHAEILE